MRNYRRRGFFLDQFLIPLFIALIFLPLINSCILILSSSFRFNEEIQDTIALAQLRHIMFVSDEYQVYDSVIYCQYHHEPAEIRQVNRNLLLQPGTQIFLTDVDYLSFFSEGQVIGIEYTRKDRQYRRILVHE